MENVIASWRKTSLNYITNGKLKIKYDMDSGEVSAVTAHDTVHKKYSNKGFLDY